RRDAILCSMQALYGPQTDTPGLALCRRAWSFLLTCAATVPATGGAHVCLDSNGY
ncbi:hypothetical protein RRG08_064884, partial [Elysia crispata]